MQRKIRVLLHSMTFKRDFGFVYCLSRILENLGCEVFVCSNTDYTSLPMRLWNPDVVFYVTVGRTEDIRRAYPRAQMVLWNAESCRFGTYPPLELAIASNKEKYQYMGRVFLWGEETKQLILDHARKGKWSWITDDVNAFDRKFVVVGHPRLDLAKYGAKITDPGKNKVNIGIIGLCSAVNNGKFSIPEMLLNDKTTDDNFLTAREFAFQIKYFQLIKKMQFDFPPEKYQYSLRPYFLENIRNYYSTHLVKSGKLHIDDSIEFTSWINDQDLIIGAVSTTMYLVAAANKPYISVDHLLDRPLEKILNAEEYLSGISIHCPKTYGEFISKVKEYESIPLTFNSSTRLQDIFKNNLSSREELPALFLMSRQIIRNAEERNNGKGYPTAFCRTFNRLRTSYAEFRGLSANKGNYSHFKGDMLPVADKEFTNVVNNIMKAIPEKEVESI